jgi:hypothetical protein
MLLQSSDMIFWKRSAYTGCELSTCRLESCPLSGLVLQGTRNGEARWVARSSWGLLKDEL